MATIDVFNTAVNTAKNTTGTAMDKMIDAAPAEQKGFLQAQKQVQLESQIMSTITNLMKKMDDMAMAAVNNLK
ncbi:hypothetical protein HRD49_27780 [Corallococcus exiguus]|uniref:Uncharacterized protein n=1 Tax=Corallococcus exiguus TaxID=83462 RepID=A0A5C5DKU2_9BACT|nr:MULTISPECIES: hypothetical protein [Corallococcus]RKI33094.1 hypothetical protein D7Y27_35240 [Corallococcus sp. AB004]MBN8466574.1 hypothetical protein [Corallococcus exiguus]MBN8466575.1 hypothetical protein [Corallococcus exiguus]MBN8466576.1 hypothetical protein [Corallococcus exiguus]NBC42978.1 hypothetical protein [Corallococcus exiguus]